MPAKSKQTTTTTTTTAAAAAAAATRGRMTLVKTLPSSFSVYTEEQEESSSSGEQQEQQPQRLQLHHALRASGGDARTWYNRRLHVDCESLVQTTLAEAPSTASIEMGAEAFVPFAPNFKRRLCTERFVLSFAGARARLPPHLRFLADLKWVQTMDHNVSTLTPSYAAVDPRDGQVYCLYDHAILDPAFETQDHGSSPHQAPAFSLGVWLLARDHTRSQPQQQQQQQHKQHTASHAVTRTSSLHMQVLLCGHKHGGRQQDRAPVCPVCPWSCPCLVDEWYDEATETPLMQGTVLAHVCVKVKALVVAAHEAGSPAALMVKQKKTKESQQAADSISSSSSSSMLFDKALCPLVPLTERLLMEPALRQELFSGSVLAWCALDETRFILVETNANGHSTFLRACSLCGGGEEEEEAAGAPSPPFVPGIYSDAFALTGYVLDSLGVGGCGDVLGLAAATATMVQDRIVFHTCVSLRELELKQQQQSLVDDERKAAECAWLKKYLKDVKSFHKFLRIAFNDQLLHVLTHPYSETSEPCFHLPQGFVDDLLSTDDPTRRATVVPMLQQRGRMPFPSCLTDVQRETLAVAEERNWRFIRKGLRPPCLLLLNEAQLQHAPFTTPVRPSLRLLHHHQNEAEKEKVSSSSASSSSSPPKATTTAASVLVLPAVAASSASSSPLLSAASSTRTRTAAASHKNNNNNNRAKDNNEAEEAELMRLLLDDNDKHHQPQQRQHDDDDHHHHHAKMMDMMNQQPKKKKHHRTKAQRKAAQRARLQAEAEQDSLVEALRLSILALEESALEDELARRDALQREAKEAERAAQDELLRARALAEAEAARLAEAQTRAEVERALETLLRAQLTQPALVRDGTAQLLRADQTLWEPLLRQGMEHPDDDRNPLDAACVMCLDTLNLATASFPWTAPCIGNQPLLLCNRCFLALRDRQQQKQQPCVCATQHPFAPGEWRLATEWVGRRWLAAHIGYSSSSGPL